MISPHDHSLAEALKTLLIAKTSIVDFRVFGSRARGDAADDSDMDVFIEVKCLSDAREFAEAVKTLLLSGD